MVEVFEEPLVVPRVVWVVCWLCVAKSAKSECHVSSKADRVKFKPKAKAHLGCKHAVKKVPDVCRYTKSAECRYEARGKPAARASEELVLH